MSDEIMEQMAICKHCDSNFNNVGIGEASAENYTKKAWIETVKEHLFKNNESDHNPLGITFFSLCGNCKEPNFVGLGGSERDFLTSDLEMYIETLEESSYKEKVIKTLECLEVTAENAIFIAEHDDFKELLTYWGNVTSNELSEESEIENYNLYFSIWRALNDADCEIA